MSTETTWDHGRAERHRAVFGTEHESPAPLDPSKVKAGDEVTVRIAYTDGSPVLTTSGKTHRGRHHDGVYLGGWRLTGLPDYVTLTAHQPAPEPEPLADVVAANLRGEGTEDRFWYVDEGDTVSPYYVDDVGVKHMPGDLLNVRPLVVIDPATAHKAVVDALGSTLAKHVTFPEFSAAADAVLKNLGLVTS